MNPDVLYHYCASEGFSNIITSRQLRLSTLSQGNDWMEGRHPFRILSDLLTTNKSLLLSHQMKLYALLQNFEYTQLVYGLGFCLSAKGDLLSQWRGYAADGTGVAIGFSRQYLEEMVNANYECLPQLSLSEVQYGDYLLREEMESRTDEILKLIAEGALDSDDSTITPDESGYEDADSDQARNWLFRLLTMVKLDSFRFKSEAFSEEFEYRLLATSRTDEEGPTPGNISYRAVRARILPYASLNLRETDISPISELVLGPKHETPIEIIQEFLELNGFKDVKIMKSSASYR